VREGGSLDPLAYLRSLTGPGGDVRYSRTSRQTPVWVTAQAVMALAHKPLPLAPIARRAAPAATATPEPATTPTPTATPKPKPKATATATPPPLITPSRARRAGFLAGTAAALL
jgi:hypothetical protein